MGIVGMGLALNPDNQRKLAAMRQALVAAEDGSVSGFKDKQLDFKALSVSTQSILNASYIYCVGTHRSRIPGKSNKISSGPKNFV